MPVDAPSSTPWQGSWTHRFADAFGRPLKGSVNLSPLFAGIGEMTLVTNDEGVVTANLPPGRYFIQGRFRTVDNYVIYVSDSFEVEES